MYRVVSTETMMTEATDATDATDATGEEAKEKERTWSEDRTRAYSAFILLPSYTHFVFSVPRSSVKQ